MTRADLRAAGPAPARARRSRSRAGRCCRRRGRRSGPPRRLRRRGRRRSRRSGSPQISPSRSFRWETAVDHFSAGSFERRGHMSIFRDVFAEAAPASFVFARDLSSATVQPPLPFQGEASFQRAPSGPAWSGSLSVDFPGREDVQLAGPRFTAHLARDDSSGAVFSAVDVASSGVVLKRGAQREPGALSGADADGEAAIAGGDFDRAAADLADQRCPERV